MIQVTKYGSYWPSYPGALGSGISVFIATAATLDAASEGAGIVWRSGVAKSIRKIIFNTGTATTGGVDNLDLRVETVGTDGLPTGTLWAANTNVAHDLADTDDNVWITSAALTADAVLAVGDQVAIVIRNPPANFGNWIVRGLAKEYTNHPYGVNDTTGAAWAKTSGVLPLITVEYSDGTYEPIDGITNFGTPASTAYNSGTATNERGNIFKNPFWMSVAGIWVGAEATASADYTVKVYDTDGTTVLATTGSIDGAFSPAVLRFYPLLTQVTLPPNSWHRVVLVPDTANNVTLWATTVATAAMMDMHPMGQDCYESVKTSGSWVETTTRRAWIGVRAVGFDDGAPRARFQIGM